MEGACSGTGPIAVPPVKAGSGLRKASGVLPPGVSHPPYPGSCWPCGPPAAADAGPEPPRLLPPLPKAPQDPVGLPPPLPVIARATGEPDMG